MFLPFDIGEIHGALELAYKIIDIGWSSTNNAHQQYIEFKQDIEALKEQLESLQLAISLSRARTGALLAPRQSPNTPNQFDQIFGSFRDTLEDCRRLLEREAVYGNHQGPVYNLQWFLRVKDEVNMHRDRIAVLNTKLSLALQSLEIQSINGQSVLMLECTDLVLQRLELLDSRVGRLLGEPVLTDSPRRMDVPLPIEDLFISITAAKYGGPNSIPMAQGVDEIIFYLDRATQWHARRQSTQSLRAFKYANVLRAYWLLQATKSSDDYQEAITTISVAVMERQLPRLGMTARRFFAKLEDRIFATHAQLMQAEQRVPSLIRLQEIVEQDRNAWHDHVNWTPQQEGSVNPRRGERVARCRLRSTTTTEQSLEVYQQEKDEEHLTVITCGTGQADVVHPIDLKSIHLEPSLEAVNSNTPLYLVTLSPAKSRRQDCFRLAFHGEKDLFKFQQWMTGYKVVDDFPNTSVVSQRANAVIGGERRAGTGRVQLWSSTRPSQGQQLPEELVDAKPPKKTRRSSKPPLVSPYPPMLAPLAAFSRLSLSLDSRRASSTQSIHLDAQAVPRSMSGTPSLTRTSTVTSSTSLSQSSSSSLTKTVRRPTNLIQVDKRGNVGCILDEPDPPRLVIFLPSAPTQGQVPAGSGQLLVIDIDQYIRINPTLCDCQQQHDSDPSNTQYPPQVPYRAGELSLDMLNASAQNHQPASRRRSSAPTPQPLQCRKVILQVAGVSGMTARETDAEGGEVWNLASAGRYQGGEGLAGVKRVKKVALEFRGVEERKKFVEYFTALRKLYLGDLVNATTA